MKKANLFLHIGTFKTGTTALQHVLASCSADLAKQNILYYKWQDDGFSMNHAFLANALLYTEHHQSVQDYFAELMSECKKQSISRAVVSAEGFYCPEYMKAISTDGFLDPHELYQSRMLYIKRICHSIPDFFDVKIIIYLRRQDYFFESFYNQVVKGVYGYKKSVFQLINDYAIMADYNFMLDIWTKVFGKDKIIVRVYEKEQLSHGVVHDFFHKVLVIDEVLAPGDEIEAPNRINISLSRDVLEYKRILNNFFSELSFEERKQLRDDITIVSHCLTKKRPELHKSLLAPEERHALLTRYNAGNAYVAKEYLGRKNEQLFMESLLQETQFESYPGLAAEKAIEIAGYLYMLQKRRLEAQIDDLKKQVFQQQTTTDMLLHRLESLEQNKQKEPRKSILKW